MNSKTDRELRATSSESKPDFIITFDRVSKIFLQGKKQVTAIDNISLNISKGELIAVMGPSGSGKSTLLHLSGTLDTPSSGIIRISDKDSSKLNDRERAILRRRKIGFVFQFFNLVPTLTVRENVALPLLLDGIKMKTIDHSISEMLEKVGLKNRELHLPEELSGGEMQRVAIARALITNPELLLADEPTGNLDTSTGEEIMKLIKSFASDNSRTVIIVTHDHKIASYTKRIIKLRDGSIESDNNGNPTTS